jgi:hypothetical protein
VADSECLAIRGGEVVRLVAATVQRAAAVTRCESQHGARQDGARSGLLAESQTRESRSREETAGGMLVGVVSAQRSCPAVTKQISALGRGIEAVVRRPYKMGRGMVCSRIWGCSGEG